MKRVEDTSKWLTGAKALDKARGSATISEAMPASLEFCGSLLVITQTGVTSNAEFGLRTTAFRVHDSQPGGHV